MHAKNFHKAATEIKTEFLWLAGREVGKVGGRTQMPQGSRPKCVARSNSGTCLPWDIQPSPTHLPTLTCPTHWSI